MSTLTSLEAAWLAAPPLIPRDVLFGPNVVPLLSPDGRHLAYVAPDDRGAMQIWVHTDGEADPHPVTALPDPGVRAYRWAFAPDTLLYQQDLSGDENWHIFVLNLRSGVQRDLTPFPGVRATMLFLNPSHPETLLAGLNLRDRNLQDVYRIDLRTGELELDTPNPGDVLSWAEDAAFHVRGCQAVRPEGGVEIRVRGEESPNWKAVLQWGPDDEHGDLLGFSADGRSLWLLSSAGRDTLALVRRDLESGHEVVVAADPDVDVGQLLHNPLTREVDAVSFDRERTEWRVLQPVLAAELTWLRGQASGDPEIVSRDSAQQTWIVAYRGDTQATSYYVYERPRRALTFLCSVPPGLDRYQLAPMEAVTIPSRDGLPLLSYLTLPLGLEPRDLPMVLLVHGGPWVRDRWEYSPYAQWLCNRGYAVLQVNYRGSAGFGKRFLNAGNRESGGKMHDDLIDGVRWAIARGIADPARVGIMGRSYGGYAALVGATFTPDVFACAVALAGPSNLVTALQTMPPQWHQLRRRFALRFGDLETEPGFLAARSPALRADRVQCPLLIAHGTQDPKVKLAEAEQMVAALRAAHKTVDYLPFAEEGHHVESPANQQKLLTAIEAFLAKHLGGRAEP
jgi:dipeptidyl aminopeptidase/acylaminoacyl peptidase